MGQLIIEVPQPINRTFQIKDEKFADEILRLIDKPAMQFIQPNLPDDLEDVDENEAFGIWADRADSAWEIARKLRDRNNCKI